MPPCHGGDRRFESGRARQYINPSKNWGLYIGQAAHAGIYFEYCPICNEPMKKVGWRITSNRQKVLIIKNTIKQPINVKKTMHG